MIRETITFKFTDSITKRPRGEAKIDSVDRQIMVTIDPTYPTISHAVELSQQMEMIGKFLCDVEADQRMYPCREFYEWNLSMEASFEEEEVDLMNFNGPFYELCPGADSAVQEATGLIYCDCGKIIGRAHAGRCMNA